MFQIGDGIIAFIEGAPSPVLGIIIHIDLTHRPSYMIYSAEAEGTFWIDETYLSHVNLDGNDILKGMV